LKSEFCSQNFWSEVNLDGFRHFKPVFGDLHGLRRFSVGVNRLHFSRFMPILCFQVDAWLLKKNLLSCPSLKISFKVMAKKFYSARKLKKKHEQNLWLISGVHLRENSFISRKHTAKNDLIWD
jgi:hypothetical protein